MKFTVYTLVILSALLLFIVEPLAAKELLPHFGGTPSTWGATLVFFQFALLAGYFWAHCLVRYFNKDTRSALQLGLVIIACAMGLWQGEFLDQTPSSGAINSADVLVALARRWGGVTFLLCTTSPLIQGILVKQSTDKSVYWLYALSNVGSLLGLLAFPFLLEPLFRLDEVIIGWKLCYFVYSILFCALVFAFRNIELDEVQSSSLRTTSIKIDWSWFVLSAISSMLLLAVTAYCTSDVAAVPLFWVIPLALYLLTWIITFSNFFHYRRLLFLIVFIASLAAVSFCSPSSFLLQWLLHCSVLFSASLICHGELSLRKPACDGLTHFYLTSALGSCFGAVFISFAAPVLFSSLIDYRLTIFYLTALIILLKLIDDRFISAKASGFIILFIFICSIPSAQFYERFLTSGRLLDRSRNFYGVFEVTEEEKGLNHLRTMNSGSTIHGYESQVPALRGLPIAYFSKFGAVGSILSSVFLDRDRNVGVIGLGAGTLAYYMRSNDKITFFEINPSVVLLAKKWFSFLSSSKSSPTIVSGDARIKLSSMHFQNFDLLVIDAFSGDSIPIHLITLEAMELYLKHLKTDGVLIYHISNRFLDLGPVLAAEAAKLGLKSFEIDSRGGDTGLELPSQYFIVARDLKQIQDLTKGSSSMTAILVEELPVVSPWTDSYSNILAVIK